MLNEVPKDILEDFLQEDERGVVLTIRVKPGSAKEKLTVNGQLELVLSIGAKALENAANIRVKELLGELFSLPPTRVEILSGHKSRIKRILLHKKVLNECLGAFGVP